MKIERKLYESRGEKTKDFFLGVLLFVLINAISAFLFSLLANQTNAQGEFTAMTGLLPNCLLFLINLGLLVGFGFTRYWIALGMLGTFSFLLALSVLAGIVLGIICMLSPQIFGC